MRVILRSVFLAGIQKVRLVPGQRCKLRLLVVLSIVILSCNSLSAQVPDKDSLFTPNKLKTLSLEELMNIEVISVSKRLEKLVEAASAIQVISGEEIRMSGAKTLAEALRLAPNLQVAQVNASQWAISARGFNNVLANKLLVLINGRVVYTPLYAGVFWDVQNVMLEDIERIEVISGPGGTLWGANAVNGVINIITKNTKDTKGLFVEGAYGDNLQGLGGVRFGGEVAKNLTCRVYGMGYRLGNTVLNDGTDAKDEWGMAQGGMRLDWDATKSNQFTFSSNIYEANPNPDGLTAVTARGDNIITRWNHQFSEKADFQLQVFYDHTLRDFNNGFKEDLKTYDLDWQNRYQIGGLNTLTYGLGFRMLDHNVSNLELFGFFPGHQVLYQYSAFVQDELMLVKDHLRVTLGTKVEYNSYTEFEYQPNVRLSWVPNKNQTIWAAASRAVRTPSRIDRDFALFLAPGLAYIAGSDSFISETMMAYELGWRLQPVKNLSVSLATFYNTYDDLRSVEPGPPPFGLPITFGNGVKGETYGLEFTSTYQVTKWWSLRAGFTHLKKSLWVKEGSQDQNGGTAESNDPENQGLVQSMMYIPGNLELGIFVRYIDRLSKPSVPDYMGLDVRIGWKFCKILELSVVGQNLLDDKHPEFIPSSPSPREIQRSFYGKITVRI